jgi:uncharacterized protein (DUF58 family)
MGVVFLGALIRDINLLMLLFGFLAGPLVYSLWYCGFAIRHLRVRRDLPEVAYAGDLLEVEVEIHNPRRLFGVWAVLIHDHIILCGESPGQRPHDARLMFLYVPAGKSRRLRYQVQLLRRGVYRFGPIVLSTRFPLGLFRRSVVIHQTQFLTVWPRLGKLKRGGVPGTQLTEQLGRHVQRVEGDFYGLRDWRAGDSRRWIHWRTTARMGELMVRQFERHRIPDFVLLIEVWQPPHPTVEQIENVELAVSLAATLITEACQRGGRQVLLAIAGAEDHVVHGSSGGVILRRALNALTEIQPTSEDRMLSLLARLGPSLSSGAHALLVTSRPTAPGENQRIASREDARVARFLSRVVSIHTGSPELVDYFAIS